MGEQAKEEYLKKMEKFFLSNLKIKKILNDSFPEEKYNYDQDSKMNYGDILYKSFRNIRDEFFKMTSSFLKPEIMEAIDKQFYLYEQEFLNCNYDYDKLKNLYKKYLSNMSEDLVNAVNENCKGYYLDRNINGLINNCTSVNELLHVLHSYVVNNEEYYQSMPKIAEKSNTIDEKIVLYGRDSELANNIFESIPIDLDMGSTDILSLNDGKKILIMIRDRGHALSIEIDDEEDKLWVHYFIPKICDVEEAQKIKGIGKINGLYGEAKGEFLSNKEEIIQEIIKLIDGVPVDKKALATVSI